MPKAYVQACVNEFLASKDLEDDDWAAEAKAFVFIDQSLDFRARRCGTASDFYFTALGHKQDPLFIEAQATLICMVLMRLLSINRNMNVKVVNVMLNFLDGDLDNLVWPAPVLNLLGHMKIMATALVDNDAPFCSPDALRNAISEARDVTSWWSLVGSPNCTP
jgi:hypothetical protein